MTKKELHWQLISQLLECCLLEQWFDDKKIKKTTLKQYFKHFNLSHALAALPDIYQQGLTHTKKTQQTKLWVLNIATDINLLLPVTAAYCAPVKLLKPYFPLLHNQADDKAQDVIEFEVIEDENKLLDIMLPMLDNSPKLAVSKQGIDKLKGDLKLAYQQSLWSANAHLVSKVYAQPHWQQTLIASEQWASLVDRPFHPLAKCKIGLNQQDYHHYMAEFNQPIVLKWVAVAKSHLMVSECLSNTASNTNSDTASDTDNNVINSDHPAYYLLDNHEQMQLDKQMSYLGIKQSHVAIPVHPWQITENVINSLFAEDIANKIVIPLNFTAPKTYASSSMRSMLLPTNTPHSIKLPLGVYALNSKRYLPALKLINGEKNQALLTKVLSLDLLLAKRLFLWDERCWWGYMFAEHTQDKSATNPGFYHEKPTHLGAMLRTLPQTLCNDEVKLITMASLGVISQTAINNSDRAATSNNAIKPQQQTQKTPQSKNPQSKADTQPIFNKVHIFDEIIISQGQTINKPAVMRCFAQLCTVFFEVMLRCLRFGLAPEMHGQNVVLVLKNNNFVGVLLRDHDSVRIHLPWLTRHHIADPSYLSPPNFRNRLYRDSPQDLIFYLQSLGILVNIRAIIDACTHHYQIDDTLFWQQVRLSITQHLKNIDFTDEQRQVLWQTLLDSKHYPHKTLLLPVIERGLDPHGSMPAGESDTVNPLTVCLTNTALNDGL